MFRHPFARQLTSDETAQMLFAYVVVRPDNQQFACSIVSNSLKDVGAFVLWIDMFYDNVT